MTAAAAPGATAGPGMDKHSISLHLVSDTTGETLNAMARASVAQFQHTHVVYHRWNLVRTRLHLHRVLEGTMAADIVPQRGPRRIVLDTEFTNALKPRPYGEFGFHSAHIYRLYAYLRSQGGAGNAVADAAEGVLLYPALDEVLDEAVTIQGHRLRFVTVDLSAPSAALRELLLDVVRAP